MEITPVGHRLPRGLAAALVLMGFVATSAQVLLIRRLMSALYGNELVVGLVLALWMAGTAAGSLLAARASDAKPRTLLAGISTAVLILVPATVLGTYGVKAAFGIHSALALGPGYSAVACAVLLLPLTAVLGAAFVFFSTVDRSPREERIGAVYLFEAFGAAAGGLACGLAASVGLDPFQWAFAVSVGAGVMVWLTAPPGLRWRLPAVGLLVLSAALVWGPARILPSTARSLAWPGYELMETKESLYASIVVAASEGQRTMFVDALPDFTAPDVRGSEELIHTALLQHPDPKRVLLIGGGLTGAAGEVFKHGVERLDYVQLDPEISRLERIHFGGAPGSFFSDPRVSVHNVDGRYFLSEVRDNVYDVIIVNAPDPATALINRFYTSEFFISAKSLLASPAGVLSFGCGEVANYVSRSQGRLLGSLALTLSAAFKFQATLPLGRVYFVASDEAGVLTAGGPELARRLDTRGIQTAFMRDYYLSYDLSDERVEYLVSEIKRAQEVERPHINMDRDPVGYFYYLIHWYRLLGSPLAGLIEGKWAKRGPWMALCAAAIGLAGTALAGRRSTRRAAMSLAVLAMGFVTLASQVVLLLAFQTFQGYLFHSVGLIVAAFMVGLSLGAVCVRRKAKRPRLWPIQTALAGYCGVLSLVLVLPLEVTRGLPLTAIAVGASLAGGILGGALFQAAAAAMRLLPGNVGGASDGPTGGDESDVPSGAVVETGDSRRQSPTGGGRGFYNGQRIGSDAGLLNACDHLGAAVGALAAASFLLPVLGMSGTAALAAAAAAGSGLGLASHRM